MGLCNEAVSHWAAKDATLSLQGHESRPTGGAGMGLAGGRRGQNQRRRRTWADWLLLEPTSPLWQLVHSVLREGPVCSILIIWHKKLPVSWVISPQLLKYVCTRIFFLSNQTLDAVVNSVDLFYDSMYLKCGMMFVKLIFTGTNPVFVSMLQTASSSDCLKDGITSK